MATWQELYRKNNKTEQPVSDQNKITQTKEQFLQKYASSLDANGRFIPGKANLWFDGESASDVYDQLIGKQTVKTPFGNRRESMFKEESFFNPEVNMDWIDDPRTGGGWAAMKGAVLPGLAATAAIMGGQALLGTGLGGGGAAGASGASTAFGGPGSFAGANAVTAGDLALTAMPQVTPQMVGLTGAQAAGIGAAGGASSGLLSSAATELPQVTITGSKAAGAGGLLNAPTMAIPSAVTAADLALAPMPQVTAATVGSPTGLGSTIANAVKPVTTAIKGLNDLTGGNLGAIAGGLLGAAASGDTKTESTSQKDPWKPAQPYLLENLQTNSDLQKQYAANPFSNEQKTAYQNSFNNSDNFRNNVAPGLLGMVNSFQPYQRQRTEVGQGGYAPQQGNGGFLSPNMQMPQGGNFGQIDWSKYANIGANGQQPTQTTPAMVGNQIGIGVGRGLNGAAESNQPRGLLADRLYNNQYRGGGYGVA